MEDRIVFFFSYEKSGLHKGLADSYNFMWTEGGIYGAWYAETLLLKLLFLEEKVYCE